MKPYHAIKLICGRHTGCSKGSIHTILNYKPICRRHNVYYALLKYTPTNIATMVTVLWFLTVSFLGETNA